MKMRDHAKKFIAYLLVIILSFVGFRAAFHSSSSARTLSQDYDDPKPKQRVNSSKMLDDQSQMQWLHQNEGTDDDGILLASSLLPIVKTTTSDRSAAYTRPFSDRRNLLENFSTTNERGPDSDTQGYNSIHGDVLEPEEVPYNYSGGASPYNSITEGQEDYLADFIIQDENEMNFHSARILSVSSSTVGDFRALHCNSNLNGAPCTLLSETNTAAEPYVVPCGACYLFDLTDGQVHEFPGGIDIKGKLKFAVNKKVTVRTPFVIVQGEVRETCRVTLYARVRRLLNHSIHPPLNHFFSLKSALLMILSVKKMNPLHFILLVRTMSYFPQLIVPTKMLVLNSLVVNVILVQSRSLLQVVH